MSDASVAYAEMYREGGVDAEARQAGTARKCHQVGTTVAGKIYGHPSLQAGRLLPEHQHTLTEDSGAVQPICRYVDQNYSNSGGGSLVLQTQRSCGGGTNLRGVFRVEHSPAAGEPFS